MTCLNCSRTLTCGCQKKMASNGKWVCSSCIQSYENNLKAIKEKRDVNPKK